MGNKLSKRVKANLTLFDKQQIYKLPDAVDIVLKAAETTKFDESIDVAVRLGVDARQSSQMVRGVLDLPHGNGRKVRIAVLARDNKAAEAREAGADIVGAEDLIEAIKANQINFDVCIASPDMMGLLGPVAQILGRKGLMPNPKLGTVTIKIKEAVEKASAGQAEYRLDKAGIIHTSIGKASFGRDKLVENIAALLNALQEARPVGAKGVYFKTLYVTSTMGPGVKVQG